LTQNVELQPLYRNGEPIKSVIGHIKPTTLRGNYAWQNTNSLAIVNIRLCTIPTQGDPYISVANTLAGWFTSISERRMLFTKEVVLDIDAANPRSLAKHQRVLKDIIKSFQQ